MHDQWIQGQSHVSSARRWAVHIRETRLVVGTVQQSVYQLEQQWLQHPTALGQSGGAAAPQQDANRIASIPLHLAISPAYFGCLCQALQRWQQPWLWQSILGLACSRSQSLRMVAPAFIRMLAAELAIQSNAAAAVMRLAAAASTGPFDALARLLCCNACWCCMAAPVC